MRSRVLDSIETTIVGLVGGRRLPFTFACLCLWAPLAGTQETPPALAGVWSTTVTAIEHPGWTIEEIFACNCLPESYEYLSELLGPENDHLSAAEIQSAVRAFNDQAIADRFTDAAAAYTEAWDPADDPSIQCEYFGAFRTILHNDPILIEQHEDRVAIKPEDMASDRTIHMDGRDHPASGPKSGTGHSIGWYEGRTLVVETVDVAANIAEDNLAIHNSDQASSMERYTLSEDGTRLHMQFTLTDPMMYYEPLTFERTRLFTPEVSLEDAPCEAISGQR